MPAAFTLAWQQQELAAATKILEADLARQRSVMLQQMAKIRKDAQSFLKKRDVHEIAKYRVALHKHGALVASLSETIYSQLGSTIDRVKLDVAEINDAATVTAQKRRFMKDQAWRAIAAMQGEISIRRRYQDTIRGLIAELDLVIRNSRQIDRSLDDAIADIAKRYPVVSAYLAS